MQAGRLKASDATIKSHAAASPNRERSDTPDMPVLTSESEQDIKTKPSPKPVVVKQCRVCGKRFKRPSWLKYHMKTRHPETKLAKSQKAPAPPTNSAPQPAETGDIKKHYNCQFCEWKFKNPDRLAMHVEQHHGQTTTILSSSCPPEVDDLSSVHDYFGTLHSNQSARIVREMDTILKQTNHYVRLLNAETNLENSANFDQLMLSNRALLNKQLEIYDSATQIMSVKRDSLRFAFEDWMRKHSPEPIGDVEDYSTMEMDVGLHLELNSDGTIVSDKKNGATTNGETCNEPQPLPPPPSKESKDVECQTNIAGSDLQLSDCLQNADGTEFEFLDSKTGMYFTNKPQPEPETETEPETEDLISVQSVDDDDEDMTMVELIEVDENFDDVASVNEVALPVALAPRQPPGPIQQTQPVLKQYPPLVRTQAPPKPNQPKCKYI